MKTDKRRVLSLLLAFGLLTTPALFAGQKKTRKQKKLTSAAAAVATASPQQSEEQRTRELLVRVDSGEIDGLAVKVLKRQTTSFVAVDPASDFRSGDSIKVEFQSNFNGYVYIINVTPGGKKKILYPYEIAEGREDNNTVRRGQRYQLPRNGSFDFNDEVGVEVLQVYFSRERVKLFDEAVKNTGGALGTSAASAVSELAAQTPPTPQLPGGINTENITPAWQEEEMSGVRTRKIRLAPGKSQEKVAIPEDNGKPIKMEAGDVAVFEIRLKHI